ncbi:MAG TPA: FAD-dependent oxidoreductase [Thermomicrobiales bacterium]|nr:FAD-dependent oxidoreductase [Thermomicrobiales bacterium]
MAEERLDAIVVGAGPAGITAARELVAAGLSPVVLERGQYPGAKNAWGGILYREPTEAMIRGFEENAPLERPIIEQRYVLLSSDAAMTASYKSMRLAEPPYNAYTAFRGDFDQWYAQKAEEEGVEIYPEFAVTDLLWEDGAVVGVTTGDEEGELFANAVVLADGANSLLGQKAGLHREWQPDEQALVAKETLRLDATVIEERFNLPEGKGTALEIFGESTWGMLGYGFIYTNKDSLSIGTGSLLSDLISSGRNVNDMLDRFKKHPAIQPLIGGAELEEYAAHLIPEGGYKRLPTLYGDGVLLVGDAAGLVNPLNREGVNLAMMSGKLAGQAIAHATEMEDFSRVGLSRYRELLEESFVLKDLYKIRNVTEFANERPWLLTEYPELLSEAVRRYLTVSGRPKKDVQDEILGLFARIPKKRLVEDALGALRAFKG